MHIAVMSDAHDNIPLIEKAIKKINKVGADLVVHCGDFSAPFAVNPYRSLHAPMIGVYGNNDAEKELIRDGLKDIGKEVKGRFATLYTGGAKIAVTHGDEADLLNALEDSIFQVVLHGHTHKFEVRKINNTLMLNPGEVCGYLTGKASIATIELPSLEAKMIKL